MKFCYADESGHGSEYVVVVGVIVDAIRMHRTKDDWQVLIEQLDVTSGGRVPELKGGDLYRGNDYWRRWDGGERTRLIEQIIKWMVDRKHSVTFGAVSKSRLADFPEDPGLNGLRGSTEWSIAALHLILGVQKQYQREKQNKGNTVFVFDNACEHLEILNLVLNPPDVTGPFYNQTNKQTALDQVIDVPYFADSRHVGLIQVADLFAYLIRLYAELSDGVMDEKFSGELEQLGTWIHSFKTVLLPDAARWPKRPTDLYTGFLKSVAPPSLLEVAK